MRPTTLILFTSCYPYGTGETFLEVEIQYLAKSFDQIFIVTPDINSKSVRDVPSNVSVVRKSFELTKWEKLKSLFGLFSKNYFQELKVLENKARLMKKINLSYFLISNYKGKKTVTFLNEFLRDKAISPSNLCLYSYWWLDEAIGICSFKKQHPETAAVSRCHGYDLYEERTSGNYLPFRTQCIEALDRIFPISENGKKYIEKNYLRPSLNSNKIIVSRLGVYDGNKNLRTSKSEDQVFKIVSCSLIYPNKRLELIIETLSKLDFKVHWAHFGSYVEGFSEEYYELILEKAAQLDTSNIEVEFKGHIQNSELLSYYAQNDIDLFVNLSKSEGIPVSIMEAMSYSIPVLATNVGGTSEIVDNENGILVEESVTINNLVDQICSFRNLDREEVNAKRSAAYTTFDLTYNAETNYKDFVRNIENIDLNDK